MTPTKQRLLIPKLIMGGFLILALSWLFFMAAYLHHQASRPRAGAEAAPVLPQTNAAQATRGR